MLLKNVAQAVPIFKKCNMIFWTKLHLNIYNNFSWDELKLNGWWIILACWNTELWKLVSNKKCCNAGTDNIGVCGCWAHAIIMHRMSANMNIKYSSEVNTSCDTVGWVSGRHPACTNPSSGNLDSFPTETQRKTRVVAAAVVLVETLHVHTFLLNSQLFSIL